MKAISELSNQLGIKLLQRGASGVGKTHRALQIALQYGPVLVLDFDGNVQRNVPLITKLDKTALVMVEDFLLDSDAQTFKVNGIMDTAKRDAERVTRISKFVTESLMKDSLEFATIIVDTSTSLSELIFNSLKSHPIWGQRKETMGMYGELGEITKKLYKDLAALPVNLIVNAHEEVDGNGVFQIVGHGKSASMWEKPFADKHRIIPGQKTLVPKVRAAMAEGLVCGNAALLDADGFIKSEHIVSMFDDIAIRKGS